MNSIDLHIIDITHNSIGGGASEIKFIIEKSEAKNTFSCEIIDNGRGIPKEMLETITDPYSTTRTERKVGLGIPLLKFHAELTGGEFSIDSELGKGTSVKVKFNTDHPDCQPVGDMAGTLAQFITQFPDLEISVSIVNDRDSIQISSSELKEAFEIEGRFSNQDYLLIKELLSSYC